MNNVVEPIWLVDRDYIIVACNAAFQSWVRAFAGKKLDKGDHVLDHGKNAVYNEKFETCYALALSGKTFSSVEDVEILGELRYTTVSFNPVYDENMKVTGICCTAKDITEHRQHLNKIEEQNTALREIAFIESHRVRAPLANILGLEQFFNYNNLADPANGELMKGISKLSHELDAIIKEVVLKSNNIGLQP